jgi:predicted membrane-bound spermidine synthase
MMLNILPRDSRHLVLFACAIALLAEAIGLTGVVRGPVEVIWHRLNSGNFFSWQGWVNTSFLFLYLGAGASRREMLGVATVGAVVSTVHLLVFPPAVAFATAPSVWLLVPAFWCSLAAVVALWARWRTSQNPIEKLRAACLLAVTASLFLFTSYVSSFLNLTLALAPRAYDLIVFNIDGTLGFQASMALAGLAKRLGLSNVVDGVYESLTWVSALFFGLYYRSGDPARPRLISFPYVWVLTMLALPAYLMCPVSGPEPTFGVNHFPDNMTEMLALPANVAITAPSFRNGIPSMHMGWALLLWLNARLLGGIWLAKGFGLFALLTAIATVANGEHFLIDLVIALPFVAMIQAAAMVGRPWHDKRRSVSFIVGLIGWLSWLVVIRLGGGPLLSIPGLTWLAVIATIGASVWAFRAMESANQNVVGDTMIKDRSLNPSLPVTTIAWRTYGLFFVSGIAGLIYEVLFSKALALTFGSTSTAAYTVLAVYMGGMALGAWLGGRLAQRSRRPLVAYALCEMAIGLYCVLTPLIFSAIRGAYVAIAGDMPPDAAMLTLLRILLGAAALLAPTILMGATLPLLIAQLERQNLAVGNTVARLYGANTLGASLGALLCGYVILPALGVFRTTLLAALLNLLVALVALQLYKRVTDSGVFSEKANDLQPALSGASTPIDNSVAGMALLILGVGGVVTLALEVHYMHLLAVVAGNSTYAFSLMLAAFLLGLGAGSEVGRRLLRSGLSHVFLLAGLEIALATAIWFGLFQWDGIPDHFAAYEHYQVLKNFSHREFVRAWVCLIVMLPPAFVIGAAYPVAMDAVARGGGSRWLERLGIAAAVNTLGNIVGVLAGGFVLLAVFGAFTGLRMISFLCLILALVVLTKAAGSARIRGMATVAALAIVMATAVPILDYTKLTTGANVYFRTQHWGDVIDRAESLDGGLTTVNWRQLSDGTSLHTLLTNGKFQGNDSASGETVAQAGFAIAPLLHTEARDNALVIGYGTGMSARTLSDAGFRQLDIVDLSSDIIRLADRYFGTINGGVRARPGVTTHVTDGRNYLMLQQRRYDVISMEISSIWFAGAASLYNREFYQLAKPRLNQGGVLQQWVQLHHMHPMDLLRILGSLRSEFKYVWVYFIGGQGIVVASDSPTAVPSAATVLRLDGAPGLRWALDAYEGTSRSLLKTLVLSPDGTDRMLRGNGVPSEYWVSTDDSLALEYSTPRGNSLEGTLDANIAMMQRFVSR